MKKDNIAEIVLDGILLFIVSTTLVVCANLLFSKLKHTETSNNPLIPAIAQNNSKLVLEELEKAAKATTADVKNLVLAANERQQTPLILAAYSNLETSKKLQEADDQRAIITQALLKHGADIQALDHDQWNALSWAAWSGLTQTTTILVDHQIQINQPDRQGNTPLMIAALRGNHKIVEFLLQKGADRTLLNKKGESAQALAHRGQAQYTNLENKVKTSDGNPDYLRSYQKTIDLLK